MSIFLNLARNISLGLLLACSLIIVPLIVQAEEVPTPDCGNIIGLDLVNEAINDCGNPFGTTNTDTPVPIYIDGESVSADAVINITDSTTHRINIERPREVFGYDHFLYRHEGTDYQQVTFEESFPPEPTLGDWRAYLEEYFDSGTDIEPLMVAIETDDTDHLTEEEEDEYFAFFDWYDENYSQPSYTNLQTGTYTLVSKEIDVCISQTRPTRWEQIRSLLITTAHANFCNGDTGVYALTFTITETPPEPTGASSILFLPGIKASDLYRKTLLGIGDKIWTPNSVNDVGQLEMTSAGESVNDIYTDEVIKDVIRYGDVYKNFINYLELLKSDDNLIVDYKTFPYDWRYDVFDIARNGTETAEGRKFITDAVNELANTSNTNKVTIIAHSNGGLLAKALLIEHPEVAEKIDKIILIGSPQLGTPKAIGSILHGFEEGIGRGLFASEKSAREILINLPGAYGLLPGQAYITQATNTIVTFADVDTTSQFRAVYGNAINDQDELSRFLIGTADLRSNATKAYQVAKVNTAILARTLSTERTLLDNWVAPAEIEVFQIVGVGLNTVSGFDYQEFKCSEFFSCPSDYVYKPVPYISPYGDKTVMMGSANGYVGGGDVFYLDLKAINDSGYIQYEHGKLTEINSTQSLITELLSTTTISEIPFVSKSPGSYDNKFIMFAGHSPVSLMLTDSSGHKVKKEIDSEGFINYVTDVDGSSYFELGGSDYLIVPVDTEFELVIEGEDSGSVTFTMTELSGESQNRIINLPVASITASTTITVTGKGSIIDSIIFDQNGDGIPEGEYLTDGTYIPVVEKVEVITNDIQSSTSYGSKVTKYDKPLPQVAGIAISNDMTQEELLRVIDLLKQIIVLLENLKARS